MRNRAPVVPARKRRRRTPIGAAPGTLNVDPHGQQPIIRVMAYDSERFAEQEIDDPEQARSFLNQWPVTWINVDGLGDAKTIRALGEIFGLHRLALEDVTSPHQRAKVEQYGEDIFIVARMPSLAEGLGTEQVSFFLGKNFLVSFQEKVGDCFDPVRDRIRHARGRVRQAGADYLAYALFDAIVDAYFPIVEEYGEKVEAVEDQVMANPGRQVAGRIHQIKRDLIVLRRAVWPLREGANSLCRDTATIITNETRIYLRDCYDHTIQIMDLVEGHREAASDLMNLYLTCISNRMNEVMKVLTIIATIFIPLTFIAGIYGMNFDPKESPLSMPELKWYWGYPCCLAVMAVVAIALLAFFQRKGWLGQWASSKEDTESQ